MPTTLRDHLDNAQAAFLDALDDLSSALLAAEGAAPGVRLAIEERLRVVREALGYYETPRKQNPFQAAYRLHAGYSVGLRAFDAIDAEIRDAAYDEDAQERAAYGADIVDAAGR